MSFEALVVGGGYLGGRLLDTLGDKGRGLTRSDFDLDAGGPLPLELPERYKLLYTVPPARDSIADVRLERLLDTLSPTPARFVYISTTGVYGDHRGGIVDETTPVNPTSDNAARRVAAEQALGEWSSKSGCELVILRVPGIYGPGRLGLDRLRQGGSYIDESEASPGNRIHVDDLASCCIAALDDGTPGGIYNVADGDHRSATWFAGEVARQAGLPAPRTISRARAEREFSPMRLAFLASSRMVDATKMREVLGVVPRSPEEGIRQSL